MPRKFRYKDIQLTQLRSFCVAATRGNFTSAAEALGLSVSTVWEQVRALEQKLGGVLFRHRGRSVELTAQGQALLELVQPHINGLDSLERLFEARCAELPPQLTVASTQYLLRYHLPRPIQEFSRKHPQIHLNVQAPGAEVMPLVERGEADLAIAPYDREKPRSPALEYEDLFELPFMLLTAADHPLARKRKVQFPDVIQYPLILPSPESYTRRVMDRIWHRHGFTGPLRVVMETLTFDTIQKYVALGVGVGLMHMSDKADRSMEGLHWRVFDPAMERLPVALAVRKYAHLAEPVQEFCALVRRHLRIGRKET
jgi:DNA-binding transcriptional LysR family regulator